MSSSLVLEQEGAISQSATSYWLRIMNALFLVAGTCIGGGMLALPISSSSTGFWPAILVMFISCIFMTITGLLFLEATLWMGNGAHLISLASRFLNQFGRAICWVTYLFIGYASLIAYVSSGGKEIAFVLREILLFPFSNFLGSFAFITLFGVILYLGHRIVEKVNTLLFLSMLLAYGLMIGLGHSEINLELLQKQEWNATHMLLIVPLMLATFSFPGIVPTIVPYLKRDVQAVRIAIIGGTTLTFLVYLIWLLIVFGSVPLEGPHGLHEALACDIPATECLHYALNNPILSYIAQFFAFFALATSFLGIALALFDFLSDGLKISKEGWGKMTLILIIAIPVLLFALYFERAFITALELSGGIGDALISGLIPAIIIWNGRYKQKVQQPGHYQVMGGKFLLVCVGLFSLFVLLSEIAGRILNG
jgi:tyrosine-specific transport protein